MDALFLLIPFSALLVLALIGVFAWALQAGQFENVEHEGARILVDSDVCLDPDQPAGDPSPQQ